MSAQFHPCSVLLDADTVPILSSKAYRNIDLPIYVTILESQSGRFNFLIFLYRRLFPYLSKSEAQSDGERYDGTEPREKPGKT